MSTLVTSKAGSVIAENLKVTLATAAALSPSQLVAMVGIAQGTALQVAPTVTTAISQMQAAAATWAVSNPSLSAALTSAASNLSTQSSQLLPPGNHGAFGSILSQAQSHVSDMTSMTKSLDFLGNTNFNEFGEGISNMADLTTQGINNVVGSLTAAGQAFKAAGPMFDLGEMSTFGTSAGLISKLQDNKLANMSGVNAAIAKAGIDLNTISDPMNSDQLDKILTSITDPKIISTITSQFGATPYGQINNLKDLTDISKLANPAAISGLTGTLTDMADKFSSIGAKFADLSAAEGLLNNLEVPDVLSLNSAFPSTASLATSLKSSLASIGGSGSGTGGLPNMQDFVQSVSGGPTIDSMLSALSANTAGALNTAVSSINSMVSSASALMSKAGIDLTTLPAASLSSAMGFASSLHSFGADSVGSGVSGIFANMTQSGAYGDAIKSSLIEGKNKMLMAAAGIRDLNFNGETGANPFAGLPSAGESSRGATFLTGEG